MHILLFFVIYFSTKHSCFCSYRFIVTLKTFPPKNTFYIINFFEDQIWKYPQLEILFQDPRSKIVRLKSSHRRCPVRKGVLRNLSCLFFDKVATLLKKRLWHRCFPLNFAKFLRTPFLLNTCWRLLLKTSLTYQLVLLHLWVCHRPRTSQAWCNMPQKFMPVKTKQRQFGGTNWLINILLKSSSEFQPDIKIFEWGL